MKLSRAICCVCVLVVSSVDVAEAQLVTRGFDRKIPATALNAEVIRQPSLQVMEVHIKPVRIVWVDLPNPSTGELERRQVWYLVWKAINRPLRKRAAEDVLPINDLDDPPGPLLFMPHFTLVTYDDPETEIPGQILPDEVLPEAQQAIEQVERTKLNNTVTAVQEFPKPIDPDAEDQEFIYGVATWSKVDAKTDFFKVILNGFTNGYENRGTDENPDLWRKVVIQRFDRPGDEYDPTFREFKFRGAPEWTYQPDAAAPQAAATGEE